MTKKLQIRNSTAEFLVFTQQTGDKSIEVRYEDETIWLSQRMMAELFDVDVRTINEHLQNLFSSNEIEKNSTIRNFRIVQTEGTRQVERNVDFYNLDAIISVGYRVNSVRATQFRQWATQVLKQFAIRGYVIDKKRLDKFLNADDREILNDSGKVTAEIAKAFAETEFEKYRVVQDQLFESDFDKQMKMQLGEKSDEIC